MSAIQILKGHKYSVYCLTVWNNHLYSGSWDKTIRKWNSKGECVGVLKGHTDSVECLTVWNNHLYSGSEDKTIRKWNSSGECVKVLEGHTDSVWCLTVWNNHLYSGSSDETIRKWGEFHFKYYKFLPDTTKKEIYNVILVFKRLQIPKFIWLPIIRHLI